MIRGCAVRRVDRRPSTTDGGSRASGRGLCADSPRGFHVVVERDCRDLPHELERSFNRLGLGRGSGANAMFWGNVAFGGRGRGGRESAVVADVPRQVPHRGPTGVTQMCQVGRRAPTRRVGATGATTPRA